LSAARDFDKARREMVVNAVDTLSEDLARLFELARTYHASERSIEKEGEIKISFQDFSIRLNSLMKICRHEVDLAACRSGLLLFKRSTTGSHFEDEHTGPVEPSGPTIQSITTDFLKFRQALLGLKHHQFSS
jgi:hypothetical protein